jgi:hypothetical protein
MVAKKNIRSGERDATTKKISETEFKKIVPPHHLGVVFE